MDEDELNEYIAIMGIEAKQAFVDLTAVATPHEIAEIALAMQNKIHKQNVMRVVEIVNFDRRNIARVDAVELVKPDIVIRNKSKTAVEEQHKDDAFLAKEWAA